MASPSTEQVRGVYVSANNVGYVPLNNYPNTTEYSFSDVPVNVEPVSAPQYPAATEAAPAEPRRCFFRRCCRPVAFPRLACSSRLFLVLALILAAVSMGGKRWYSRSFVVESDDPMATQLGYSVDYRETIGLFKVCYHLKASPVPNENGTVTTDPIDHKECMNLYQAFGRGQMPPHGDMGSDQQPPSESGMPMPPSDGDMPPPENMPGMGDMGEHHHRGSRNHREGGHHGGRKHGCKGGVVFCAVKGVLIASFVFSVLAFLFTCTERRGCCATRKRGVIITQPVFAGLAFLAVLAAVIFAAAGSVSVATKPPSAPLASVLNGPMPPMAPMPLHFRFGCSFFLALGALFFALLSTVLFTVRSARLVQQLSTAPAVPSS